MVDTYCSLEVDTLLSKTPKSYQDERDKLRQNVEFLQKTVLFYEIANSYPDNFPISPEVQMYAAEDKIISLLKRFQSGALVRDFIGAYVATYDDKFKLADLIRLLIQGRIKPKPEREQMILRENEL